MCLGNRGRAGKGFATSGHGMCSYIEVFKLRDPFVVEIHYLVQGWHMRVPIVIGTNEAMLSEPCGVVVGTFQGTQSIEP